MPILTPKLSLEEHIELGRKIKKLNKLHTEIMNEVHRGYGVSCRAAKLVEKIVKTSNFACEMDNIVIRETSYKDWQENNYGSIYLG